MNELRVRSIAPEDTSAVESLCRDAFPDEDLVPLVSALLDDAATIVTLVADVDTRIAGFVVFTRCAVSEGGGDVALLGPLAVAPARQRRGIGGTLVRAGLARLEDEGVSLVCVLGDPAYYGRFGFRPEARVEPPFPLPPAWDDAWRSRRVGETAGRVAGTLRVPPPWEDPALWTP